MTKYSFENFYLNMNNKQAFFAARYAADHLGEAANPLYIYGGPQTGKTHILHAMEQYLHDHYHDLKVVRVTTEEFVTAVIDMIRHGHKDCACASDFRDRYRNVDVLLIDDIEYLSNKEATAEEFLHTFDAVFEAGGQIVITGNSSLRELRKKGFPEKFVSRLEWGRVVEIPSELERPARRSLYDELNDEHFSIPEPYTPLEYFQELWLMGLREYIVPEGKASSWYLKMESMSGLRGRYGKNWDDNSEIKERWEYELDKIDSCEMNGFYLVLWDLVNHAKSNGIIVSPGCGAVPGSIVAYGLGITDVDPIRYNLLMDRFLSRKQEPHAGCRIELEIGGSKRLADYVTEKYGKGMLKLLEMIGITFRDIEELSAMKETMKKASLSRGEVIDIAAIDYNDKAVFNLINAEGCKDLEMSGELFNMDFAKRIEVGSMEDLIARFSMDRPGLEERCAEFVKNKNNPEQIHYDSPELEYILAPTYGYIVYQEQIMQILSDLGGFLPEESNTVRRGMSKRQIIVNETGRHDFIRGNINKGISGCVAKGISEAMAERIFDDMWMAAPYSFNKSHVAAYATIAYQLMWLKHYYGAEYMAAVEYVRAIRCPGETEPRGWG